MIYIPGIIFECLKVEDYLLDETLRTTIPYGLNSSTKNCDEDIFIGSPFPRLPRTGAPVIKN